MRSKTILSIGLCLLFSVFVFSTISCKSNNALSSQDEQNNNGNNLISSRSYSGHESDADSNNFVSAYSTTLGTRLDDCQTCHRSGAQNASGTKVVYNPCSHCHLLKWPDSAYTVNVPASYYDTLNQFGKDYLNAGRSKDAILAIADNDSDGDGSTNGDEIANNRFPGDSKSMPGQPLAQIKTIADSDFTTLIGSNLHEQFLLMNTTKQQYDDYATYRGVKVKDLLTSAGVDLTDAAITGISVFAPDGFKTDFSISDIINQFPDGIFYSVPQPFSDLNLNFVNYEDPLPAGVSNGSALGNLWLMIAGYRGPLDTPLSVSYYDPITGKLEGEGPFRIIPPQKTVSRPDRRSSSVAVPDDGWNFISDGTGENRHNAGSSVRGMCIIRVNPMPSGYEEYDTSNGWSLIAEKKIVIYGYGIN